MPASPETVGAYLAATGLGYALPTLRRRVAAIARAHRIAKQPLDTRHPAIRETLRGIARTHGEPARRSAALTTPEIRRLIEGCSDDLAGFRDRALILIGFAGALRRSELVGLDAAHVRPTPTGLRLMIPRSKTDAAGEGAEVGITRGSQADTCPVRALHAWLDAATITDGPIFRRVTQWGTVGTQRLHPDAVRQILTRRAAAAGITGTLLEPVTPRGMRAGFVTTAYRNGVSDDEIMGHCWRRRQSAHKRRGIVAIGRVRALAAAIWGVRGIGEWVGRPVGGCGQEDRPATSPAVVMPVGLTFGRWGEWTDATPFEWCGGVQNDGSSQAPSPSWPGACS
jgi:integrase